MCLAIPGKILEITDDGDLTRSGKVDFGGVQKEVALCFVPRAGIGNHVLVHAGFAISIVDEEEARKILALFREAEG
jgi:hydrogenase expression/formation protein HypC